MNFAFSVTKDTNNLKLLPPKSNKFLVFKMLYNGDFTEVFKLNLIPCYGNLLNKILCKILGRIIFFLFSPQQFTFHCCFDVEASQRSLII